MSDPVTKVGIEDVLSSIRRLLTQDARFAPDGEFATRKKNDGSLERLILGPSYRVPEETLEAEQKTGGPVGMLDSVVENEVGRVIGEMADAPDEADAPAVDIPEAPMVHVSEELPGNEGFASKVAALESVLSRQTPREGWRDDLPENEAENAGFVTEGGDALWARPEAIPQEQAGAGVPEAHAPQPAGPYTPPPEALVASPERDEAAATQSAAIATPELPDAEALRPLVEQVLREELQGELGERITRNVRKLVRREIRRVLLSGEYH
ncbi:hypothetical protein [Allosediminivita pacifica]|uniref:Uncharacterized protein n=1 Tax=Allosediminivita pacifica TaxID=1267769 RepID=A0A2T6ABC6_9RHOB|nr:hypothetical protein [Allosediminivita pacifica]PTX41114.1 hypothetical protein C8N44_13219 [Allosediminivita pacifica]GGB25038.1 hypothetical protein GCM10011324_38740 [Allosediminivita pacifica]